MSGRAFWFSAMALCLLGIVLAWALAAAIEPFAAAQGAPQNGKLYRWAATATPFLLGGAVASAVFSVVKLPAPRQKATAGFDAPSDDDGWAFLNNWKFRFALLLVAGATIGAAFAQL